MVAHRYSLLGGAVMYMSYLKTYDSYRAEEDLLKRSECLIRHKGR